MTEIVEKIESLPDGVSVGGLQNVPDSDVCCFELDVTTDDLKSLAVQVKAQDDVIREMREALEHYASDKLWNDVFDAYLDRYARQTPDFADKAKAVLDKFKAKGEM